MAHVTLCGTFRRPITKGIGFHERGIRHLLWNFATVTHDGVAKGIYSDLETALLTLFCCDLHII
jgi:hypothetical protein